MLDFFDLGYLVIISAVSVFGILASAFIVVVNLLDWAKGRTLNTCDQILLSTGIVNVLIQCIEVVEDYVSMIWKKGRPLDCVLDIHLQLAIWFSTSSFWLNACLCLFYCVKIVDCNHPLFIWLKLRISKVVPWMIFWSVVGSLFLSVPAFWNPVKGLAENSTIYLIANSTAGGDGVKWSQWYLIAVNVCGSFIPLLVCMASTTFILKSLYVHTQRMKTNMPGYSQPRMEAHIGAARMVGSLLLIYIFMLVAEFAVNCLFSHLFILGTSIILFSSVAAQPITVILGNTKLRKVLWKVLTAWQKCKANS